MPSNTPPSGALIGSNPSALNLALTIARTIPVAKSMTLIEQAGWKRVDTHDTASSTVFSRPAGATMMQVLLIGGGGGGGNGGGAIDGGGGGGGGGSGCIDVYVGPAADSVTVQVGAGGASNSDGAATTATLNDGTQIARANGGQGGYNGQAGASNGIGGNGGSGAAGGGAGGNGTYSTASPSGTTGGLGHIWSSGGAGSSRSSSTKGGDGGVSGLRCGTGTSYPNTTLPRGIGGTNGPGAGGNMQLTGYGCGGGGGGGRATAAAGGGGGGNGGSGWNGSGVNGPSTANNGTDTTGGIGQTGLPGAAIIMWW